MQRFSRGSVRWSIDVRAALAAEARGEDESCVWRRAGAVFAEEDGLVHSARGDREAETEHVG